MDEEEKTPSDSSQRRYTHLFSLKTKGFIFIFFLMVYGVSLTYYGFYEKEKIFHEFLYFLKTYDKESHIMNKKLAVFDATIEQYAGFEMIDLVMGKLHVRRHLDLTNTRITELKGLFGKDSQAYKSMRSSFAAVIKDPTAQNLTSFRKTMEAARNELAEVINHKRDEANTLTATLVNEKSRAVVKRIALLGIMGFVVTILVAAHFFSRLAKDMKTLEANAEAILNLGGGGSGGGPKVSPIKRRDEIGSLGGVLCRVEEEMSNQQQKLEIERKKLFHSDKMAAIGTLASGISHEIGNPISAIQALLDKTLKEQKLNKKPCPNRNCREHIDIILKHTERLVNINWEISGFSSPQSSKLQLIDINSLAQNATNLMKYDKRCQNFDIKLDFDTQLPAVKARGDQILQVFINLLINSADALADVADKKPTITLATSRINDFVCISVSDNGHGIDEESMDHVFEAFYTTKPAGKGTGLGLSLCHSIIADHDGKIEFDSEVNVGTTVKLLLPLGAN